MRILITGSRYWTDYGAIYDAIRNETRGNRHVTIIHGGASGADHLAGLVAQNLGLKSEEYPAQWQFHGKSAGPIRNQEMVDDGADICLAFPTAKSIGTWDCVRRAKAAGIPVKVYGQNGAE